MGQVYVWSWRLGGHCCAQFLLRCWWSVRWAAAAGSLAVVSIILHLVLILWCGWLFGGMRDTKLGMTPRFWGGFEEAECGNISWQASARAFDGQRKACWILNQNPVFLDSRNFLVCHWQSSKKQVQNTSCMWLTISRWVGGRQGNSGTPHPTSFCIFSVLLCISRMPKVFSKRCPRTKWNAVELVS